MKITPSSPTAVAVVIRREHPGKRGNTIRSFEFHDHAHPLRGAQGPYRTEDAATRAALAAGFTRVVGQHGERLATVAK